MTDANCPSVPTVSVVIPTYNRAGTLSRCVDSVFDQTFDDYEIIVVDDSSTDNTHEVIQQYGDHRLRYIAHEENKGQSAARNTGIVASQGKYIAFLDSDDEWLPEKLEKQLQVFKQSPYQPGVVYTGHYVSDSNFRRIGSLPGARGDIYEKELMTDRVNPTSTVMVKKACFDSVGKWDTDLPARVDYDMWLRLSQEYTFDYVQEPLAILHVDRTDRISSQYHSRMKADMIMLDKVKSRASELEGVNKRKVVAKQYESIAEFAYISKHSGDARKYIFQSILKYPFDLRRWILLSLIMLFVSPDNRIILLLKDRFERIKSKMGK